MEHLNTYWKREQPGSQKRLKENYLSEKSKYLTTFKYNFSKEEKKWLLKVRLEDIDITRTNICKQGFKRKLDPNKSLFSHVNWVLSPCSTVIV